MTHDPSHLDIEQPLFQATPHLWVQWKGTDVCADIHCSCGTMSHFDGKFLYFVQCPSCGAVWEVGTHIPLYPSTAERAGPMLKVAFI